MPVADASNRYGPQHLGLILLLKPMPSTEERGCFVACNKHCAYQYDVDHRSSETMISPPKINVGWLNRNPSYCQCDGPVKLFGAKWDQLRTASPPLPQRPVHQAQLVPGGRRIVQNGGNSFVLCESFSGSLFVVLHGLYLVGSVVESLANDFFHSSLPDSVLAMWIIMNHFANRQFNFLGEPIRGVWSATSIYPVLLVHCSHAGWQFRLRVQYSTHRVNPVPQHFLLRRQVILSGRPLRVVSKSSLS